jgi:hypothetical protein
MEGQGENDELYPIAVLIDELKVSNIPLGYGIFFAQEPSVLTYRTFSTMMSSSASMLFTVFQLLR